MSKVYGQIYADTLILPKSAGKGQMVDHSSPSSPWRDLEFLEIPDPSGTDAPRLIDMRTPVRCNFYQTTPSADKMDMRAHIPHDWLPGHDAYIHVHWLHDATSISGDIVFTFASTYASGYNTMIFPAAKTKTLTYATTDIATTPQYSHMITEVPWCISGGDANHFDSDDIEVDGLIIATLTMTTLPTLSGGSEVSGTPGIFILRSDLHYQSREVGTKDKNTPFYT